MRLLTLEKEVRFYVTEGKLLSVLTKQPLFFFFVPGSSEGKNKSDVGLTCLCSVLLSRRRSRAEGFGQSSGAVQARPHALRRLLPQM